MNREAHTLFGGALSIKRGRQPEPARMYDPVQLGKELHRIRIALRNRVHARLSILDVLANHDRAIAKLRREECDATELLHRLYPDRLAQIDASTDWGSP